MWTYFYAHISEFFVPKMKKLLIILLSLLALQTFAQQLKLVSEADGAPVAFASAFLVQAKVGTISDENGYINIELSHNDTLAIRHLSFEDADIPTSALSTSNEIRLKPKSYSLSEVTVKSVSAQKMVKKAKEFFSVNYPISLSRYNLSVENLITSNDSIYSCLRASVICTSLGYTKEKSCEYRLQQADTYINRRADFAFRVPYSTDAYPANLIEQMHLVGLDFIKNISDYRYSYAEQQPQGVYVINFVPKKISKKHYWKGTLVINAADMAIMKVEYTTAAPDVVAFDEKVVELSYIVKVYSEGKHHIKSCSTTLDFEKVAGLYQLVRAENHFDYKYIKKGGMEFEYSADNSVVNHFGTVDNIENYKQIALYGYDLTEWKHNSIKSDRKQKFMSKKISR